MEISYLPFELYRLRSHLKTAENGKYEERQKKMCFHFIPNKLSSGAFSKINPPYPPASTPPDESITLTNLPLQTPIYSRGLGGRGAKNDAALLKEG